MEEELEERELEEEEEESGMTLIEHLEELRRRIIISLATALVFAIGAYFFAGDIIEILRKPLGEPLKILYPAEAFIVNIKVALFAGVYLALPLIFYELWGFISPGLKKTERKYSVPFALFSMTLFTLGALFAYWKVLPLGLNFLLGFAKGGVEPNITLNYYLSFIIKMLFAFGIVFQMPLLVLFLTLIKLIDVKFMIHNARYAILTIFILGAILTPPDIFTQLMLALPLLILYGISIIICKLAGG